MQADIEMSAQDEVGFPQSNIAEYIQLEIEQNRTFLLTGDKGYKTALSGHGVKHGDYYFEMEVLAPKTPLPFVGVKPAVRVGLTTFKEQDLELPLGSFNRSYTYASTGRMITSQRYAKETNDGYCKLS